MATRFSSVTSICWFLGVLGSGCDGGGEAKVTFWPSAHPYITYKISKESTDFSVGPLTGRVSPDSRQISFLVTVRNIGSRDARDIEASHRLLIKPFPADPKQPPPFRELRSDVRVPFLEAGKTAAYEATFPLEVGDLSYDGATDLIFDFSKCSIVHA